MPSFHGHVGLREKYNQTKHCVMISSWENDDDDGIDTWDIFRWCLCICKYIYIKKNTLNILQSMYIYIYMYMYIYIYLYVYIYMYCLCLYTLYTMTLRWASHFATPAFTEQLQAMPALTYATWRGSKWSRTSPSRRVDPTGSAISGAVGSFLGPPRAVGSCFPAQEETLVFPSLAPT